MLPAFVLLRSVAAIATAAHLLCTGCAHATDTLSTTDYGNTTATPHSFPSSPLSKRDYVAFFVYSGANCQGTFDSVAKSEYDNAVKTTKNCYAISASSDIRSITLEQNGVYFTGGGCTTVHRVGVRLCGNGPPPITGVSITA